MEGGLRQIKKIGWIGTGVMGSSMIKHLLKAGFDLMVYNRTKSKTDELCNLGAVFAIPRILAQECDIVFLMLGYPSDVENIVLKEETIIDYLQKGSILVDHTTSSPNLAKLLQQKCVQKGIYCIDAPVSGGDVGAKEGKLSIMVGGDKTIFDHVTPIFEKYGKTIRYQGLEGSGQHAKMANQIAIASGLLGVCEALIYGYKAELDLEVLLDTIGQGAAASFSLNVYGPRILKRNFDPGFFVKHFVKDMRIALEECQRMSLCLPGLALVQQLYTSLMANGGGNGGTQSLMLTLEQMNNLNLSKSHIKSHSDAIQDEQKKQI